MTLAPAVLALCLISQGRAAQRPDAGIEVTPTDATPLVPVWVRALWLWLLCLARAAQARAAAPLVVVVAGCSVRVAAVVLVSIGLLLSVIL